MNLNCKQKKIIVNLPYFLSICLLIISNNLHAQLRSMHFNPIHTEVQIRDNQDPFSILLPFKNTSSDTIKPKVASPSGILVGVMPSEIAPGCSGAVILDIHYRGAAGKKNFPIIITCKSEVETLSISCVFKLPFAMEPEEIKPLKLFRGDTIPITVSFHWNGSIPSLFRINSEHRNRNISSITIDSLNSGYALTARIVASEDNAKITDTIIVDTDYEPWPSICIPVSGVTEAFLSPQPSEIDFGRISSKKRNWKKVVLQSKRIKYEIERVNVTIPFAMVSIGRHPDRNWELAITMYPDSPVGPFNGEILVYLPGYTKPELIIPVKGELF